VILGNIKPFKGQTEFEIYEIYVDPLLQGKGVGSKLILHLQKVLANNNVHQTTLLTRKSTAAFEFYKSKGYQCIDDIVFLKRELLC